MSREWKLYFDDMQTSCEKVIRYTRGLGREEFESNHVVHEATLWNVLLIGEAANHIPEDTRDRIPEIPWRELIGIRNRLVHGYFGINNMIVWQVIAIEIPRLQGLLQNIVDTRPELFEGQT